VRAADAPPGGDPAANRQEPGSDLRVGDRVRVLPPFFESPQPVYEARIRAVYPDADGLSALVRADGALLDDLVADVHLVLLPGPDGADRDRAARQARLCARWDAAYGRNRLAAGADAQQVFLQYRCRLAHYVREVSVLAPLVASWLATTDDLVDADVTILDAHRFFEQLASLLDVGR
jgi:hypothetical protein